MTQVYSGTERHYYLKMSLESEENIADLSELCEHQALDSVHGTDRFYQ